MVNVMVDLDEELNESVAIYKIENKLATKENAIIQILKLVLKRVK